MTTSPPKEHNFDAIPTVHSLDEFFHRKYEEDDDGEICARSPPPRRSSPSRRPTPTTTSTCRRRRTGRWSSPLGLPIIAFGVIYNLRDRRSSGGSSSCCVFGWALEPSVARSDDRPAERRHEWRRRAEVDRPSPTWRRPDLTSRRDGGHETRAHGRPAGSARTETSPSHADTGHATTTGLSNNKLAMWLFLGSECLLFGGSDLDVHALPGPHSGSLGPDQIYDIPFTSVSALRAADELADDGAGGVGGEAGTTTAQHQAVAAHTALLGATFVGGQVYEFTAFYREGLGFTTSLFGVSFYTLTGFHGVHVTVGIIMLLSLVRDLAADRIRGPAEVVELVGLYWHFVDIVWIVIFTLVYLIPAVQPQDGPAVRQGRCRARRADGHRDLRQLRRLPGQGVPAPDAGPDGDEVPPRGAVLHAPQVGLEAVRAHVLGGALLAVAVYVGALATFEYFAKA